MTIARKKLLIICIRITGAANFLYKGNNGLQDVLRTVERKTRAHSKNYVGIGWIVVAPKPERFPNYSLKPISSYCSTDFSMDTNPQPVHMEFIWPVDQGKTGTMQTFPLAVYLLKFPTFPQ